MDELFRQIRNFAYGAWIYRWWGLLLTWTIGIAAAGFICTIPNQYQASARIFVNTESVLAPLMAGLAVTSDVDQQVQMLSKTLINRTNVDNLIKRADIKYKGEPASIGQVTRNIGIQSIGRDNLYILSYTDQNPAQAKRAVESLVAIFLSSEKDRREQASDTAQNFIDDQIKDYEKKLEQAETKVKEFKIKNINILDGAGKDSFEKIGEINIKLEQARLDLQEAQSARSALAQQSSGEAPVFLPQGSTAGNANISMPEIDTRIQTQKKALDEMLRNYTENHPDVINQRRLITQLEQEKAAAIGAQRAAGISMSSADTNPVYQNIKISLANAEASVATLRTRVAEYEARKAQAKQYMELLPQLEQEGAALNRDYDLNKRKYEELIDRREKLNVATQIQGTQEETLFNIIDHPELPSAPSAPNRKLLFLFGGFCALLAGFALCLLLGQLNPKFFESHSLHELTGLPVLGSISRVFSTEEIRVRKRRNIVFACTLASFVLIYSAFSFVAVLTIR